MELKKYTRLSMLLALSVVLNIIESVIPLFNGFIPGLKLGLANTIIVFVLYAYSFKEAIYISILRVIIVSVLRTGFGISFFFSLSGAILSIITMSLAKRYTKLSIIGVSILGSVSHSLGQIIMSVLLLKTINMLYYLPWLLIFSIPTGILIGIVSQEIVKSFKKRLKYS